MANQIKIDSRDIVLADPSYGDQKQRKIRPLLVISRKEFHQSGFFVCVGITTNQNYDPYLIPVKLDSLENVELKEQSQVMCKRIVTIKSDKIIKKIDSVTIEFYELIIHKIKKEILDI